MIAVDLAIFFVIGAFAIGEFLSWRQQQNEKRQSEARTEATRVVETRLAHFAVERQILWHGERIWLPYNEYHTDEEYAKQEARRLMEEQAFLDGGPRIVTEMHFEDERPERAIRVREEGAA